MRESATAHPPARSSPLESQTSRCRSSRPCHRRPCHGPPSELYVADVGRSRHALALTPHLFAACGVRGAPDCLRAAASMPPPTPAAMHRAAFPTPRPHQALHEPRRTQPPICTSHDTPPPAGSSRSDDARHAGISPVGSHSRSAHEDSATHRCRELLAVFFVGVPASAPAPATRGVPSWGRASPSAAVARPTRPPCASPPIECGRRARARLFSATRGVCSSEQRVQHSIGWDD